jgi:hypothetical protein
MSSVLKPVNFVYAEMYLLHRATDYILLDCSERNALYIYIYIYIYCPVLLPRGIKMGLSEQLSIYETIRDLTLYYL